MSVEQRTPAALSTGPAQCASWCEEGHGHAGATYRDDQWSSSIEAEIPTTLHEPWQPERGVVVAASLSVRARRDVVGAAYVSIRTPEDAELRLTTDEADELMRQVRHFAWVAGQDDAERNAFEIGRDVGRVKACT